MADVRQETGRVIGAFHIALAKEACAVASEQLRPVQCDIRLAETILRRRADPIEARPHAYGRLDGCAIDPQRLPDGLDERSPEAIRLLPAPQANGQHGKLVTAKPPYHIGCADGRPKAAPNLLQQLVADHMPMSIIDDLEMIDVDEV